MNTYDISSTVKLPLIVNSNGDQQDPSHFISFFNSNRNHIDTLIKKNGGIKFTGVPIDSLETFQTVVNSISVKFLSYIDGNSPRTKLSGNVYTSTEYDKRQRITMHNELSYSAVWPNMLFFSCLQPAETGGETLIADSREILKCMNKEIVDDILNRGIMYIRNLHNGSGMGIGPSWCDTFETEDKRRVEQYCRTYAIDFVWQENDNLRLIQKSKGIIPHRSTGELIWFNQIDQFHPCHLGSELFETMQSIYESPDSFPMYVKFGDGKEINEDLVTEISATIEKLTLAPPWNRNELLMLDNELMSHGRNSYTGDRKVLVSMSK